MYPVFLVYSRLLPARLRYIFKHIFSNMLDITIAFTSDADEFIQFEGPKLNYSSSRFADELFFCAAPLLFEKGLKQQQIKVEQHENVPIFYINKSNSDLPFDPFAASFYLISRYEEYLSHTRDQFDRYPAEESLAYKNGFLQLPVVDIWALQLAKVLKKRFPNLHICPNKFKYIPTYDIDIAYSYRAKGVFRNLGGYLQTIRKRNWAKLGERSKVLLGMQPDPYDTYQWQFDLHKKYGLNPRYFFLMGEYSMYDKNISGHTLAYQELIRHIADFYDIGIHPSYQSNLDANTLRTEIRLLAQITKEEIKKSRQHYIKLKIPTTYQNFLEAGIEKDYTMGYPSQIGFRASTASSFDFYDISIEQHTPLRIFPFAIMDVTLREYLKMSPQEAIQTAQKIIQTIKSVNGMFITLWHNHTLSETDGWQGWREVYAKIVEYAASAPSEAQTER